MTCRLDVHPTRWTRPTMLLAIVAVSTWATSAPAAVIYNNGAPQLVPVPAQGAPFADANLSSFTEVADNFSLKAGLNVIRDIHWWGVYGSGTKAPPADAFAIKIYNDNGGTPGTLNSVVSISSLNRTATASTITGLTMYQYDAVVTALTLPDSTTFWLGISDNSGGNSWAWVQSANSGGNAWQYSASNGSFGRTTKEVAFNLTNDIVPEPSTIALFISGLVGLTLMRWRRRTS
ncbi:MAG: PEP-CTERM sorting domain-containing protein [Pirellulales bacterium]|nr:PEP-CTERM sorting domain-containing protein [Pirellulales bacterium]